ncbi:hypothetical protein EG68_06783 [Paragonimus skrjabini miyazakii]|uniref:Uncharacterized protein n=1 Tax=Paragonimus skrjabini miyazakii TaxID=59628 RepID=A0A8S9YNU6_9TREM|nr:hypothetical protein EG68_06783 [Paragonimus skrjabini miyazakii]
MSLHLEIPTLSSSSSSPSSASPSPAVQPASVNTVRIEVTSTFPKHPPVSLGNITTITAADTCDNVVISTEDWSRMESLLGKHAGAKQLHMRLTRPRAPTVSGLVARMMQTVLHPVFAKQVNYTGISQEIDFRDSKTLAIMREVILPREGGEAGDSLLPPSAIRTWLKGSRDRGVARRRTKRCSKHNLVPFTLGD